MSYVLAVPHLGAGGALMTYLSQILERVLGSMVGRVSPLSFGKTFSTRGAESGWPRATTLLGRLGLGRGKRGRGEECEGRGEECEGRVRMCMCVCACVLCVYIERET